MAEEEKNETTEETQAEEAQAEEAAAEGSEAPAASDEGSDAAAAGPVAEDVPPADSPEEASSTPPAEETAETAEPPAEEAESEAPAAEEPPEDPDADLPWKERRRLERSRQPHEAREQQTVEERAAARSEARKAKAAARSRYRRNRRGKKGEPGTGTPPAEREGNPAKVRQGVVVSDKADKTITVRIDITRRHPTYEKVVRRSRTLHAHDERNEAGAGDVVRVVESHPLSKQKRWRLLEVLEKAR